MKLLFWWILTAIMFLGLWKAEIWASPVNPTGAYWTLEVSYGSGAATLAENESNEFSLSIPHTNLLPQAGDLEIEDDDNYFYAYAGFDADNSSLEIQTQGYANPFYSSASDWYSASGKVALASDPFSGATIFSLSFDWSYELYLTATSSGEVGYEVGLIDWTLTTDPASPVYVGGLESFSFSANGTSGGSYTRVWNTLDPAHEYLFWVSIWAIVNGEEDPDGADVFIELANLRAEAIPEPTSALLLVLGLGILSFYLRRSHYNNKVICIGLVILLTIFLPCFSVAAYVVSAEKTINDFKYLGVYTLLNDNSGYLKTPLVKYCYEEVESGETVCRELSRDNIASLCAFFVENNIGTSLEEFVSWLEETGYIVEGFLTGEDYFDEIPWCEEARETFLSELGEVFIGVNFSLSERTEQPYFPFSEERSPGIYPLYSLTETYFGSTDLGGGIILEISAILNCERFACLLTESTRYFSLTIMTDGSGLVTAEGLFCPEDCSEDYPEGTEVTLVATPAEGYVFSGWAGDCAACEGPTCTLVMDSDKTCTAQFEELVFEPQPDLVVTKLVTPRYWRYGRKARVALMIENRGEADVTGPFVVRLYADTKELGERRLRGLRAGARKLVRFRFRVEDDLCFPDNHHVLRAVVDAEDTVAEVNEKNNEISKNIVIRGCLVRY